MRTASCSIRRATAISVAAICFTERATSSGISSSCSIRGAISSSISGSSFTKTASAISRTATCFTAQATSSGISASSFTKTASGPMSGFMTPVLSKTLLRSLTKAYFKRKICPKRPKKGVKMRQRAVSPTPRIGLIFTPLRCFCTARTTGLKPNFKHQKRKDKPDLVIKKYFPQR